MENAENAQKSKKTGQAEQKLLFESGNELAAYAAMQINYHVMGYYPITPSTQIAEYLDRMGADGAHSIAMIPAEGEHSAAGICYGASAGGGRVFNATSANGLLYALEQLPVQSGTRLPMVLNVACRTVSGPLSIKGDHSDVMYTLNAGWIILFASSPQEVYDCNICALKIAERVKLPVIVAFDGFFTSHQKQNCYVFADHGTVRDFIGPCNGDPGVLDPTRPVTVGSYLNEPDLLNNKDQLHLAMEEARSVIPEVFAGTGSCRGGVCPPLAPIGRRTPRFCCSCWALPTAPPDRQWIGSAGKGSAWACARSASCAPFPRRRSLHSVKTPARFWWRTVRTATARGAAICRWRSAPRSSRRDLPPACSAESTV